MRSPAEHKDAQRVLSCAWCGRPAIFPPSDMLNLRGPGRRVYEALQKPEGVSIHQLREAMCRDGRPRKPGQIFVMLGRLDRRLWAHSLAVARIGIGPTDRIYRVVGI